MNIELWVIDHRDGSDYQQPGAIINVWPVLPADEPGERYADFCALHGLWESVGVTDDPPDIVGFFGYRKYLVFDAIDGATPAHAPNWWNCSREQFDQYRRWLTKWDGAEIKRLLAQHDVLQAAPFPVPSLLADFTISRSAHDADALCKVLGRHNISTMAQRIYQYHFITRWSVFDRMMRELDPIRQELDELVTAEDSTNKAYKERPMAYVMERTYSLWLENSGLDVKEMPVLHCWDM